LLVLTLLTVLAMVPAAVRADGDPASDVLLGENVFYPYSPPVSATLQKTLNAETAAAAKAHVPIKVALIASPVDLGVIPGLFGKPQAYAQFLDQEISFQKKQPLLVVMSTGYGVQGMSAAATRAAASLSKPAGARSDDLAQAAITAVGKLAAASGYPLASPAGKKSGGSSTTLIIVIALGVAAVLTAGALVALRRRQATGR
jgi:hypothetical protein